MSITKQTAALLFAFGFILVDKEGNEYEILGVRIDRFEVYGDSDIVIPALFSEVGTDYWILKRPYSQLTIPIGDDEIIVYNQLWNRSKNDFDEYGEKASFNMWAYEDINTLNKYHFIDLPEGTYKEIE